MPETPLPPSPAVYQRTNLLVGGKQLHAKARASGYQSYTVKQSASRQLPALGSEFSTHVPMLTHVPINTRHVVRDTLSNVM